MSFGAGQPSGEARRLRCPSPRPLFGGRKQNVLFETDWKPVLETNLERYIYIYRIWNRNLETQIWTPVIWG